MVRGQRVQVDRSACLGAQCVVEALCGQRFDGAVREHARRVQDRRQRIRGRHVREQGRDGIPVLDIARLDPDERARLLKVRDQLGSPLGRDAPATRQQQAANAVFGDEVPCDQRTHRTGSTGDQHGPAAVTAAHVEDDLSGVAPLTHLAERSARVADVPDGDRVQRHPPVGEQLHDGPEHLADQVRSRLVEVERPVVDPRVVGRNPQRIADVGLTHLDEAAALGEQGQRGVDEGVRERVQYDVHAAPARGVEEGVCETHVTRGRQVRVVQPQAAQSGPLSRARGSEDLGTDVVRELYGCHAHAARRRVDEDPLPLRQVRHVEQGVVGGEEGTRYGRGLDVAPSVRDGHDHAVVRYGHAPEGAGEDAHDAVTRCEADDVVGHLQHGSGALAADAGVDGRPLHESQGDRDVPEVEPGGMDRDTDLPARQGFLHLGARDPGEVLQRALDRDAQPVRAACRWLDPVVRRCGRHQARDEERPFPQGQLVLTQSEDVGQARPGRVVNVQQPEPAGVLRLGRPDQPPHRRPGEALDALPVTGGERQAGEHRQRASGERLLGEEPLNQVQHTRVRVPHLGEQVGASDDEVVQAQDDVPRRLPRNNVIDGLVEHGARINESSGQPAPRAENCHCSKVSCAVRPPLDGPPRQFVQLLLLAAAQRAHLLGARRSERQRADVGDLAAVVVRDRHGHGILACRGDPDPHARTALRERLRAGPGEGHPGLSPVDLDAAAGHHRVQHGVEQRGMQDETVSGRRQGGRREEVVAAPPHLAQPAEGRAVVEPRVREGVVETVDVEPPRSGRRPYGK